MLPSKEQYQANIFDDVRVMMKTFIGECHEMMMVASHKRSRYKGESKLTYQVISRLSVQAFTDITHAHTHKHIEHS